MNEQTNKTAIREIKVQNVNVYFTCVNFNTFRYFAFCTFFTHLILP